jgi:DNA ligase D-like protein (predicted 3'-phosphoesterase)
MMWDDAGQPSLPAARFVVHEHRAPRLHYDLRLEHGGMLVSWAVPKGVPLEPGVNRLAIAVADHDLEHLTYTDAGKSIWDIGTYLEHEFTDGKVVVTFDGQRLRGSYALIRTNREQWLLRGIADRALDATAQLP